MASIRDENTFIKGVKPNLSIDRKITNKDTPADKNKKKLKIFISI
jgi:hypothetical protein